MKFLDQAAFWISAALVFAGAFLLFIQSSSVIGMFFFIPISLGPLLISMILGSYSASTVSQITLSVGSILYGIWFTYVYLSAFYWHPDPQSALALIFVGIYSLPVMVPIWIVSHLFRSGDVKNGRQDA